MAPSPHADEEVFGKAYDSRLVRRLLRYIRPYARGVLVAMAMLVLLTLFELAGPLIVKQAIDDAIATGQMDRLNQYALAYLV
ncbi:MAG TPA: ABC transporter ATP-binding protein, partial [Chloroflexota bacterium]|nr:ABC transporter ATP-binding protein [Chloroflexota bacterium]